MPVNPYIPLIRQATDTAKLEGRALTVPIVREISDRDPWALMRAMDVELFVKRQRDAAIYVVLHHEGPAIPTADGYAHVSLDGADVVSLDRLITYREEQLADDTDALRRLRDLRTRAAIVATDTVDEAVAAAGIEQ
jgi:hypothetical protein